MSLPRALCRMLPASHIGKGRSGRAARWPAPGVLNRFSRRTQSLQRQLILSAALALAGCSSVPLYTPSSAPAAQQPATLPSAASDLPALPPAGSGRGAYYQNDGPGDNPPQGLLDTPDAEPRIEPYSKRGNRPYTVFGKTYTPITDNRPLKQRGVGSWYGKKFHGQKTSSGELYDMYKMTAAHPTLPIPSYVRVTNVDNGVQVIVRVNDRGPFHAGRIIDLSYTAALKLGYLAKGSGQLEVERLLPDEIERITNSRRNVNVPLSQTQNAQPIASEVAAAPVENDDAETMAVAAVVDAVTVQPVLPESPAPVAVVNAVVPASSGGFYLQLGAFSQADNAHASRDRLQQQWSGALPPFEVMESGLMHRLYSGPFPTREDAALAAQRLQDAGLAKPVIVQR